jgi:hypothetical protein
MVDLRFITNVSAFEAQGVYSFILSYPDRNLLLRAANLSDMNKWIRALQFQADIVRGGFGHTIITDNNTSGSSPQGKGRAIKEKYRPRTLEANLEATMVRLQILESNLLKESQKDSQKESVKVKERDNSPYHLRPEDVSLSLKDRERDRSASPQRKPNKPNKPPRNRDDPSMEKETRETSSRRTERDDYARNEFKSDEESERGNYRRESGNNDGRNDDRDDYTASRTGKDSGNHSNQNRSSIDRQGSKGSRQPSSQPSSRHSSPKDREARSRDDRADREERGDINKSSYNNSDNRSRNSKSNSNKYPEPEDDREMSLANRREGRQPSDRRMSADTNGDSIEEILPAPRVKNNNKIRSQVQGHRENRDNRENEINSERYSESSSSRNESKSGSSKRGNPPPGNNNWGYNGDTYGSTDTFEGGVSARQNQFLSIAAGRARGSGSFRSDSGGSGRISDKGGSGRISDRRTSYEDEDEDFDDLPEMDLTVRKPSQRAVRERKLKINSDRDRDRASTSSDPHFRLPPPAGGFETNNSSRNGSHNGSVNGNGWV